MEKDFETGVRELIKKSLPAQTADELRKALDEFDKLRSDHARLKDELLETRGSRSLLEKKYEGLKAEFEAYKRDHEDLMRVRAELAEQKEALRIQVYEIKLEKAELLLCAAERHRKAMESFMINMSRNSVFRKATLSEKNYVIPPTPGLAGENGCWTGPLDGHIETKVDKVEETIEEE